MTPRFLAKPVHSLRPILHIIYPKTMLSYSKGSRGLSVPLRVPGIFTGTTISPSSWLRQSPNRYTIRAGRNLPDKGFRYLRTVIVTAGVHPRLSRRLLPPCGRITPFRDVRTLARHPPPYLTLRFCRDLGF